MLYEQQREVSAELQESQSSTGILNTTHNSQPSPSTYSGFKTHQMEKERDMSLFLSKKRGWLWKWSIGRSILGRKNWKLRFIECDEHGLRYYASEPFVAVKGLILWNDVMHVYSDSPSNEFITLSGGSNNKCPKGMPNLSGDRDFNFGDSENTNMMNSSSSSSQQRPNSTNSRNRFGGHSPNLIDYSDNVGNYDFKVNSPNTYYFGIRIIAGANERGNEADNSSSHSFSWKKAFSSIGAASTHELTLMFKTDDLEEHDEWVTYLTFMFELYGNINGRKMSVNAMSIDNGIIEQFRRKLRGLVSLKKRRYKEDGHDLDLAYILPNIIAMGFPCEGHEEIFRNPMSHVLSFLDKYHKQYKVYNLCSERYYPPNRFGGSFERFPFDDHNPCPLQMLLPLCESIFTWISNGDNGEKDILQTPEMLNSTRSFVGNGAIPITVEGKTNDSVGSYKLPIVGSVALLHNVLCIQNTDARVAAIHCKAGKGRTGLAICAYLLYCGACSTVEDSLTVFGSRRTYDGKGIEIPSQRRYLSYFNSVLKDHNGSVPSTVVSLYKLILTHTPTLEADGSSEIYIRVSKRKDNHRHIPCGKLEGKFDDTLEIILDTSPSDISTGRSVTLIDGESEVDEGITNITKNKSFSERVSQTISPIRRSNRVVPDPNKRMLKDYTNQTLYFTNQDINRERSSLPEPLVLRGVSDFLVSLVNVTKMGSLQCVASFWLHTGFMPPNSRSGNLVDSSTGKPLNSIILPKAELDNASKDKNNRKFHSNFKVILGYTVDDTGPTIPWSGIPIPSAAK